MICKILEIRCFEYGSDSILGIIPPTPPPPPPLPPLPPLPYVTTPIIQQNNHHHHQTFMRSRWNFIFVPHQKTVYSMKPICQKTNYLKTYVELSEIKLSMRVRLSNVYLAQLASKIIWIIPLLIKYPATEHNSHERVYIVVSVNWK
jgi:hypothetical protein